MDQLIYSNASSLSSSSYQQQHSRKTMKPSHPSYHNSLHSVRKPLLKHITKQFIAPLPPTPPKVYNIDSSNFKNIVRVLTSEPEFQYPSPRRLQDIAPPPLILSTITKQSLFDLFPKPPPSEGGGMVSPLPDFIESPDFCSLLNETVHTTRFTSTSPATDYSSLKPGVYDSSEGALMSPLGFSMSPTSLSWCSSVFSAPELFPS